MSRAEEAALKAHPITMVRRRYDGIARSDETYDSNLHDRYCFQRGYEAAEKDLALTWEDIWQIVHLYLEVNANHDYIPDKTPRLICEETLKRFKEDEK